jgi:hypothetical protein
MVIVVLLLLTVLSAFSLRLFFLATAHATSDDDFWVDECNEAAAGTASDQDVVDRTLYIFELGQQEVIEQDPETRSNLRRLIREQNELLIKTIMTINLLDPQEAAECDKVISMEDYLNR